MGVRELTLLGDYGEKTFRDPALICQKGENIQLIEVDIRGWEGVGVSLTSSKNVLIQNCRALQCAKEGFQLAAEDLHCMTNIASGCGTGFYANGLGKKILLEGNISGDHRGPGFVLENAHQAVAISNNASFNRGNGLLLKSLQSSLIVANMIMNNNLESTDKAGIHLTAECKKNRLLYNNCSDEQLHPSQWRGIAEDRTCSRNVIRANVSCPIYKNPFKVNVPTLSSEGEKSLILDNVTQTLTLTGAPL